MGMGENDVIGRDSFPHQFIAEPSNSGSGINDYDIIAFCPDFYTCGVTAILEIFFT